MKSKIYLVVLLLSSFIVHSQTFDSRNDWVGKYKGNTSAQNKWVKSHYGSHPTFKVNINNGSKFLLGPGYGAGYYICRIDLPNNYREVRGLQITKNSMKFSPTRKYPFGFDLKKTVDKYGDMQLTGTIEYYTVQSNGELTISQKYYSFNLYLE